LTEEQQTKIKGQLGQQLGVIPDEVDLSCVHVQRTNLPLGEQEMFVGGKLSDLSAAGKLPFKLSHTTIAAQMLASEIQRRASDTSYATSFEELNTRLLSRKQVVDILGHVAQLRPPVHNALDSAIEEPEREQYPFFAREEIPTSTRSRLFRGNRQDKRRLPPDCNSACRGRRQWPCRPALPAP
jgi:hypothetical protein